MGARQQQGSSKAAARQQSDLQSAQQGGFAGAGLAHKHGPKTHPQGLMQLQDFVHKGCWLLQALLLQHCTCCCLQLPVCLHPSSNLQQSNHSS